MSRYGDGPRYPAGNLAYRDPPPGPRWDADRFASERDRRVTETVIERDRTLNEYRSPPRRAAAPVYEEQRYYEDDRFGPRGSRQERRYYEEDDYGDPRASRGAMIPFRPERPARPEAPPRPGIIRRQSSLDTFDRQPARRYADYEGYRAPPPRVPIPVPRAPSPRRTRYEREYYDDVRIQEPDFYGDDGFREYKEREWITHRRRNSSHSRDRETVTEKEEVVEEKPFPRRGKTKMPKRLIHTKVLFDLGYPYYEENETIIIEKALGPQNIDEIINMSKEYRERETPTTRLLEAPPEIREEIYEEKVTTIPISNAPPSVQNWDALRSPSPKSHRSRSRKGSRSRRGSASEGTVVEEKEITVEKRVTREISPARTARSGRSRRHSSVHGHEEKEIIIERKVSREISPARTARSGRTRHRSSSRGSSEHEHETVIERRIVEEDDFDESNSVHIGPLALVRENRKSRGDRDLKEEIRALEAERRALRRERRLGDTEIVKVERIRERSPSRGRGEIVLVDRDEVVEVRKDKRARSVAPSPGIIRAMMATLT